MRVEQIIKEINDIPNFRGKLSFSPVTAAKLIGVSASTLESWRRAGIGPEYVKMEGKRGKVMYPKIAIAEFLSQTIKTA